MSLLMHIILYNISFTLTFFSDRHLCIDVAYRSKNWGHCRTPVLFLKACEDQLLCLQNKSESIEVYREATLLLETFTDGFMVSSFKPHIIWHDVHFVHSALMQRKTYDNTGFAFGWAYLVIDELLTIWVADGMLYLSQIKAVLVKYGFQKTRQLPKMHRPRLQHLPYTLLQKSLRFTYIFHFLCWIKTCLTQVYSIMLILPTELTLNST